VLLVLKRSFKRNWGKGFLKDCFRPGALKTPHRKTDRHEEDCTHQSSIHQKATAA